MSSPARVLRDIVIREGLAVLPGQLTPQRKGGLIQAFFEAAGDEIDNCLLFTDGAGRQWGRVASRDPRGRMEGKQARHPAVKINLRHLVAEEGYPLMQEIADFFTRMRPTKIESGIYLYNVQTVYQTSDVVSLGMEKGTNRFWWSYNVNVSFADKDRTLIEED